MVLSFEAARRQAAQVARATLDFEDAVAFTAVEVVMMVLMPLLAVALAIGIFSVFWWRHSGDLRIYIWVQGAPLLAIPGVIALFPGRYTHRRYLLYGAGLYVLAKMAELLDFQIYSASGGAISGHTLKHLLAAAAVSCVWQMLKNRQSLTPVASSQ